MTELGARGWRGEAAGMAELGCAGAMESGRAAAVLVWRRGRARGRVGLG